MKLTLTLEKVLNMYIISSSIADKISEISNDFDDDYDQNFLKINDDLAKRISKLGFRIFNYINSADNNYSNNNSLAVELSYPVYKDCLEFLFLVKFINDNHLNNVDVGNLFIENKMLKSVLGALLDLQPCHIRN